MPLLASRPIFLAMPLIPLFRPAPARLRVLPDDPAAVTGPRPKGSRRPHSDAKVAAVRRLIEQTPLTYGEIARKTGVGRASICRWTRDGQWQRHVFAPRATDTIPRPRAGLKLKLRLLAERLRALAERYVRELEETPGVDLDKLVQALEVVKMARLEAMGRRRRRRFTGEARTGAQTLAREQAIRQALTEMRRGGVDIDRAPQEALDLLLDARAPEDDSPALHPRGWKRRW
ncbi:MAG: hypothetical protein WDN48_08210 [Pseudolabrys sp.]